ncbi:MAG: Ni/Fe-hydrogenase cytochrome b subunit [Calditrichia bacterium]|nr:Ni/Fe-hydrogenase cytochrome b subunit [Calditrichia bacterium]
MNMKIGKLTFWKCITAIIFVIGLYITIVRFGKGLGAVTHLTDEFPWGLWIGFDVLVGVGLAAGGFVIAATVHIFNIKKYESISRPAILTAFLGYLLVITALMFDLGRPDRIWHPLIMWNVHSVMFEVGWCVTLYTIVLALEFSPMVFEKFNMRVPLKLIRTIFIPIVIAGVLLSTLHQSSLGTLYVIVPDKLYGLWYSPLLPLFFFISAIAAGLAMTIFESFLSYRAFGKHLEKDILVGISRVIVVVLAVYLVLKFQDLYQRGNLALAFQLNRESILFWGEMGLGVILPMILLFSSKIRNKEAGLFFSAILVIVGFIASRLNVSITGMMHSESYFPKWTEIGLTIVIIALGFTIFAFAVKYFTVFPKEEIARVATTSSYSARNKRPVFSGKLVLALWALLIIGMICLGLTNKYNNKQYSLSEETTLLERRVNPLQQEIKLPDDFTYPLNENSPGPVSFSHENHIYFQDKPDCQPCHAELFKIIKLQASGLKSVRMDRLYEGESCGKCHNGNDAFGVEEDCEICHSENEFIK